MSKDYRDMDSMAMDVNEIPDDCWPDNDDEIEISRREVESIDLEAIYDVYYG